MRGIEPSKIRRSLATLYLSKKESRCFRTVWARGGWAMYAAPAIAACPGALYALWKQSLWYAFSTQLDPQSELKNIHFPQPFILCGFFIFRLSDGGADSKRASSASNSTNH